MENEDPPQKAKNSPPPSLKEWKKADDLHQYKTTKRPQKTENPYRNGPLPHDECIYTSEKLFGTLDSDCEQLDWENNRRSGKEERKGINAIAGQMLNLAGLGDDSEEKTKNDQKLTCSRNLVKYFSRLGKVRYHFTYEKLTRA